ncbi:helix-turn-helix domain-containing protein, partial [uncultured Ruminococcus sp.]
MANKAFKFRIYPNNEQKVLFTKTFGCVRLVYNYWLYKRIKQYKEYETTLSYNA